MDKCCSNCRCFSDEDIYGNGFCEEHKTEKYCCDRCDKWRTFNVNSGEGIQMGEGKE